MAEEKHGLIAELLKTRILAGVYPKRFPTVSALAKEFSLSSRTVAKITKQLASEGLIEPSPMGTHISQNYCLAESQRVILLALGGPHEQPLAEDVLFNTFLECTRQAGYQLLILDEMPTDLTPWIQRFSPVGVAFAYQSYEEPMGQSLRGLHIPFVALNWYPGENVSCVDADWGNLLRQLAEQLVKKGYRRIAYLHRNHSRHLRGLYYEYAWDEITRQLGIRNYGYGVEDFCCDEPPEVFITSVPIPPKLRRWYQKKKLCFQVVSRDCYEDELIARQWQFVGYDYKLIAQEGWRLLEEQLNYPQQRIVTQKQVQFPVTILFHLST